MVIPIYPLYDAILKGNLSEIRTCLANGADINKTRDNYWAGTPLICAILTDNYDAQTKLAVVKCLLASPGIDVNAKNRGHDQYSWYEMTPLRIAIRYIDDFALKFELARLLLETGANPNLMSGNDGANALIDAINDYDIDPNERIIKQKKLISLLVSFGADMNYDFGNIGTFSLYTTPLQFADDKNIALGQFMRNELILNTIQNHKNYSACLYRGWYLHQERSQRMATEQLLSLPTELFKELPNSIKNSVFLLLPAELLIKIAFFAAYTENVDHKTQSRLACLFFDKPLTLKDNPERLEQEKTLAEIKEQYQKKSI